MPFARINGLNLFFHEQGPSDAPIIFFVHGTQGNASLWASLIDRLSADFRCVALNHRGRPPSDAPDDPDLYTIERFADDQAEFIRQRGYRDITLVGWSMGVRTVLSIVDRHWGDVGDCIDQLVFVGGPPSPPKGRLAVYLEGAWHAVDLAGAGGGAAGGGESAARLDVAVLQDRILAPLLDVADVRTDPRVAFVGGARGVAALERAVDSGAAAVAFSLAPVTPDELLAVSDAGEIMPPKSTWFEPKLRDGLLIRTI